MRISVLAMTAKLAVLLCLGSAAFAQSPSANGGAPVQTVLQDDDSSLATQPVSFGGGKEEAACDSSGEYDACCHPRIDSFLHPDCCKLADLGDPFKLADLCFFKERNLQVGGWVAQSFTWNAQGPSDHYNGPVTWNDRSNEYQLNELYMFLGRTPDTKGCGWDYGYRTDLMFGTNYRWVTATGLESQWNSAGTEYGLAMPQAFVELAVNNLTVRAGHFVSPVGYHTVGTNNNFFATAPYTCQYGEPFTHTGMLFTYKFSDKFTWANGFVRGWDNFNPTNVPTGVPTGTPNLSWLSNATLTRENGDTVAWVATLGQEPSASATSDGFSTRYLQTMVYTKKFSDDVTGILQSDFGTQDNATKDAGTAKWYGVNSYLLWNQTCRLQWGMEFEWFRDEDGVRVGQALPSSSSPAAQGWVTPGGFAGNFWMFNIGPKYFLTPNLYSRASFRCDWYNGEKQNGVSPYDNGAKDHQELVILDVVATF